MSGFDKQVLDSKQDYHLVIEPDQSPIELWVELAATFRCRPTLLGRELYDVERAIGENTDHAARG